MPHLTCSDASLVLLTLSGDPTAYDELVRRHEKRTRASAYSVIHNAHIAEDAAQDAFLAAWLKLDRLREPEKFGIWVSRIAKNCAKNMAIRFRNYLSLDDVENIEYIRSEDSDPEQMLLTEEEAGLMRRGLRKLPERSQQVVYLHYYEDMSAEEIAKLMGISVGTVKSQLHDGRKKMRKELCSMDEKLNDTLLIKIRKKIEEVKSWQFRNSKKGFDKVYNGVLKDIDTMPECREKYHALADVLMRGYWWLPGEKNDKLLERIKEAALLGKNNEVMYSVLYRESLKYWDDGRRNHIKNVQIPSLDPADFRLTIAELWRCYADSTKPEKKDEALEAYGNALKLLKPDEPLYYAVVNSKENYEKAATEEFISDDQNRLLLGGVFEVDLSGGVRLGDSRYNGFGELYSYNRNNGYILDKLFACDNLMTADIKPGESFTASDGSTLTFESDCETVEVPAGKFIGCEVWTSRLRANGVTCRSWLKSGVGAVKQEIISEGAAEVKLLKSYKIVGGDGLLPIRRGNFWEYETDGNPETYAASWRIDIPCCEGEKAVAVVNVEAVRKKYDENTWLDMILKTRSDYCCNRDGNDWQIRDVRPYAERAVELAKTPYEKAYAETAYSVVKRIIETDPVFDPDCEATGLWNFFNRYEISTDDGKTSLLQGSSRFSFEWKGYDDTALCDRLCSNHIYSILSDVTGYLFDEQWKPGYKSEEVRDYFGNDALKVKISCESAGTVEVKAGSFENCLSVDTVCEGLPYGVEYRGGRRTYYFAPGVGLVKVEIYTKMGFKSAYELTSYEGTGEGYMPIKEGIRRRYEDLGLTDGYVGAAEYIYAKDCEGKTVVFSDCTGIRHMPRKITRYDFIMGEQEEERLADGGKYNEANLEGCCNAINILLYQMTKGFHHFWDPIRRAKRFLYNYRLMEAAGNGVIAPAFYARASRTCLLAAVAFIGGGEREEGYKYLELALDYAEKWKAIPEGEKLSFGDEAVFGNIVYIKGQSVIELPDGSRRQIDADGSIDGWLSDSGMIYYAMTAPRGWEWFDPARNDERYKALTERAKKLTE